MRDKNSVVNDLSVYYCAHHINRHVHFDFICRFFFPVCPLLHKQTIIILLGDLITAVASRYDCYVSMNTNLNKKYIYLLIVHLLLLVYALKSLYYSHH